MLDFSKLIQPISNLYETSIPFLLILFSIGILLLIYRNVIADTYREEKKIFNAASGLISLPMIAAFGYLIANDHVWVIFVCAIIGVIFIAFKIGLFDALFYNIRNGW